MGLALLEKRVYRASTAPLTGGQLPGPTLSGGFGLVVGPPIALNQTGIVDHLAVAIYVPNDGRTFPAGGIQQPTILVFDKSNPNPTDIVCDWTDLTEMELPQVFPAAPWNVWHDVDAAPNLVLETAGQLCIVYGSLQAGCIAAARATISTYAGTPGQPAPIAT